MDNPDSVGQPKRRAGRGVWVPVIAVLAVAGSIFALTGLQGNDKQTAIPAPAAQVAALPASVVDAQKAAVAQYSPAAEAPLPLIAPATPTLAAPNAAAAAGTVATTTSMPMPTSPPASGGCAVKEALAPFIAHLKAAHLEESIGQQAGDALNLDQYVKTHTVLIENMLSPVLNGDADQTVKNVLAPFLAHLKAAHLDESLGQQIGDLLNVDQYVKTHTVLVENMLTPVFDQLSC